MIKIPEDTIRIYLDTYGYDDGGYGSCSQLVLLAEIDKPPLYEWHIKNLKRIWCSSLLENHPDETEYNYKTWQEELTEAFKELGFDIAEVKRFDEDCIYDWEFEKIL